jgi:hypothetical protein
MPKKVLCDVLHDPNLVPRSKGSMPEDAALQNHLRQLAGYLKDKFYTWDIDESTSRFNTDFQFDLPVSNFQNCRKQPGPDLRKHESSSNEAGERKMLTP